MKKLINPFAHQKHPKMKAVVLGIVSSCLISTEAISAEISNIGIAYGGAFNTAPSGQGCSLGYRIKIDGIDNNANSGRDYVFIEVVRSGAPAWGRLSPSGLYWANSGSSVSPALNYSWRFRDGAGNSLVTNASIVFNIYEHDGTSQGPLIWSYSLSQSMLECGRDESPISDAGPDQDVKKGTQVNLDGSHSSDPENGTLSYRWWQTDGPSVALSSNTVANPSFTTPDDLSEDTAFVFNLTVSDPAGNTSQVDSVTINVLANEPPVANAGENISYGIPNMLVYLDGSQSFDEDGDALTYIWTQVAGPEVELIDAETATPSFYYPAGRADQIIQFELVVNDGSENSEPDTVTIIHNGRSNGVAQGRK